MTRILALAATLVLLPPTAFAQEDTPSLMERGAQLFLEGLLEEMAPAIDELEGLADEMGPALRTFTEQMGPKLADVLSQIEDWTAYEAPEILPNGDIIIRRKDDKPPKPSIQQTEPLPQIDL